MADMNRKRQARLARNSLEREATREANRVQQEERRLRRTEVQEETDREANTQSRRIRRAQTKSKA